MGSVPLADLGRQLTVANYAWLLPALGCQLLAIVVRARRWALLLGEPNRFMDSFWAQGVGYLFTNVFPLRLGEPARVLAMARRCHLPIATVAASAIVERLLDLGTVVLLLVLVLPWMEVPVFVLRAGLVFGVLIFLGLLLVVLLTHLEHRGELLLCAVCATTRVLPTDSIVARWKELVNGVAPLTRSVVAIRATGWSVMVWAFSVATYWCLLLAFQPAGTLLEAAFLVVALSLAVTLPSSPGFVGIFQLVGQQTLVLSFGAKYDAANALAIIMTAHVTYYLVTTGLGIVGVWRMGESFANLGRAVAVQ